MSTGFTRTFMELKLHLLYVSWERSCSFTRTFMELKLSMMN